MSIFISILSDNEDDIALVFVRTIKVRGKGKGRKKVDMCLSVYVRVLILFIGVACALDIPKIIYGTAWKGEETQRFVVEALQMGFRAIDVACQPKHYNEPGVGKALQQVFAEQWLQRENVFLQTKFTPIRGQDPNDIPYDKHAPLEEQVKQSFMASLRNLKTDYLDSLVLHSPMPTIEETIQVYRIFESFHLQGKVKYLGISNCYDVNVLRALYDAARVKPTFIQNRFYRKSGFDTDIRAFASEHCMVYQSFWTLTANRKFIAGPLMREMSHKYKRTTEQVFFAFVRHLGVIPLSGTKQTAHMQEDLDVVGQGANPNPNAQPNPNPNPNANANANPNPNPDRLGNGPELVLDLLDFDNIEKALHIHD